jgi:deoxyribonuclease V
MPRVFREVPVPETDEEAIEIQSRLAREVHLGERFRQVAGVHVEYSKDDQTAFVAATVLSTTTWSVVHSQAAELPVERRISPGFENFREAPLMVEVLCRLALEPDLVLVPGNGVAHPRRFGTASHVGYSLDVPTVGVASLWPSGCRQTKAVLPRRRGSKRALLLDPSGDRVGYEVYTQDNEDPVYVSPGHRVSADEAVSYALRCAPWYRAPEPLRQAAKLASQLRESR